MRVFTGNMISNSAVCHLLNWYTSAKDITDSAKAIYYTKLMQGKNMALKIACNYYEKKLHSFEMIPKKKSLTVIAHGNL